jgi:hypothetical protein
MIFKMPDRGFVPVACPMTSQPRASCPLQLRAGEPAERVCDLVLARVAAVKVDHRGPLTVVPHTVHQLPDGRASARRVGKPVGLRGLVVGGGLVAVGDVLGEVLGQVPDAPRGVPGPGQDALRVESRPEPGDVQRLVLVADRVECVIPGRRELASLRVEVPPRPSRQTGRRASSYRTVCVGGHHTWW